MRFLRPRRPTIGLDVGSAFVRAVALCRTRHDWSLVAAGEAALSDPETNLHATVHQLLDRLGLRRVNVSVAVPAASAIVRRLTLPAESLSDLRRTVAFEVEQHAPFSPTEASVSYQVLDRGDGVSQIDVLLGAARRSEVADRAAVATGKGRRAAAAGIEGLALVNAFTLNYPELNGATLLAHVGRRSAVICLVERGELAATRGVVFGTADGDHAITDLVGAARQFVVLRDISADSGLGRILLSGGAWQVDRLSSRLSSELRAPVEPFDPLRRIKATPASRGRDLVGPPFALAVGLALR